jgi:hypothetical protein
VRQHALRDDLAHPFSTAGIRLRGIEPPTTVVAEGEARALRPGLDAHVALAELAAPPVCFLWRWWPSARVDRLLVGDARHVRRISTP